MKLTATLATLTALFLAGPVTADDGHVPHSTLQSLGLGDMQVLTDNDGMSVRGMGAADAWGTSIISGLLLDPATKSFVVGTDSTRSGSSAISGGRHGATAYQDNFSSIDLGLVVNTNTSSYVGLLYGGAGGYSFASGN